MNKLKLKYFIVLIVFLFIGWVTHMLTVNSIYIYDVMEEELVDVTRYYDTGKFYIYTNPERATNQSLIRKQPPKFWPGKELLSVMKDKTVPITYFSGPIVNKEQIIEQIITTFPDFSERMQYYGSYTSFQGDLNESYHGYFTINNKEYTIDITEISYTADRVRITDIKKLVIGLSNDFSTFPSSYEEYLEVAKKQPQPPL